MDTIATIKSRGYKVFESEFDHADCIIDTDTKEVHVQRSLPTITKYRLLVGAMMDIISEGKCLDYITT